jgi:hypothetical protein
MGRRGAGIEVGALCERNKLRRMTPMTAATATPSAGPRGADRLRLGLAAAAMLLMAGCATLQPKPPAPPPRVMLSLDTPVGTIAAAPGGKALLDKDLPGLTTHPDWPMFKAMSLNQLQPLSKGKLTKKRLDKVQTDLTVLNASPPPAAASH